MDQVKMNEIIAIFTAKKVDKPCPRCGNLSFSIAGDNFITIQNDPNVFNIGGPSIPTIVVFCENCGYVTQHAKGPLGLLKGVAK